MSESDDGAAVAVTRQNVGTCSGMGKSGGLKLPAATCAALSMTMPGSVSAVRFAQAVPACACETQIVRPYATIEECLSQCDRTVNSQLHTLAGAASSPYTA